MPSASAGLVNRGGGVSPPQNVWRRIQVGRLRLVVRSASAGPTPHWETFRVRAAERAG